MVTRAILVWPNDSGITRTKSRVFDPSDPENFSYSAALVAFVLTRKKDIKGGTMFLDDAPSFEGAKAIIEAELKKVVYAKQALTTDQISAIQLLEQFGIETYYNPGIMLAGEEL